METKTEIRKRLIERRNMLSIEEVNEKSAAIFERLCALKQYDHAKIVLAYMDYKNEVMTGEFIKRCKRDGKRVVLPKVEPVGGSKALSVSDKVLLVYEINEVERDTVSGFKGILEPNSAFLNRMDPIDIDLAIIPAVAFDYGRYRLGYGGGFYDRFIPLLRSDCTIAGVAYNLQLVEKIPVEKYDMPVNLVVTEYEFI